jgi:elongation factor G
MKSFDINNIRNITLVSHGGAGKTSLIESFAFNAKRIDRIGKITDGNTVSDFEPEEIKRQISLNLSLIPIEWKGVKINFLDTPGYFDFVSEVKSALRVVEGCLVLVDAIAGIQAGTEKVIAYAEEFNLPTALVFNKLDRENVDFDRVYDSIREQFGNKYISVQIPYFDNKVFSGVIDIITKKLITAKDGEIEIPASYMKQVDSMFTEVLENVVEADDQILEKYLAGEKITDEEFLSCFKKAVIQRKIFPILSSSGVTNTGCKSLTDFIVRYFPSPLDIKTVSVKSGSSENEIDLPIDAKGPIAALIFKTLTDPYVGKISMVKVFSGVLSLSTPIFNATQEKEEKIGQISIQFGKNQENVESIVAGDI